MDLRVRGVGGEEKNESPMAAFPKLRIPFVWGVPINRLLYVS